MGIRLDKSELEGTKESDFPGTLVPYDTGEAGTSDVILGVAIHSMDRFGEAEDVKNLSALYEHRLAETANLLEQAGMPEPNPKIYAITSVR